MDDTRRPDFPKFLKIKIITINFKNPLFLWNAATELPQKYIKADWVF